MNSGRMPAWGAIEVRGAHENNLRDIDRIARADWVIDLGPGGGHDGGRVIGARLETREGLRSGS